jgi:hypothetical protein
LAALINSSIGDRTSDSLLGFSHGVVATAASLAIVAVASSCSNLLMIFSGGLLVSLDTELIRELLRFFIFNFAKFGLSTSGVSGREYGSFFTEPWWSIEPRFDVLALIDWAGVSFDVIRHV